MSHHTPQFCPAPRPTLHSAYVAITFQLADPNDDLLVRHVRLLRDCVALSQQRWGFSVDAAAVLPSEMHLLCLFPDADFGTAGAIQLICSAFERHLPNREGSVWSDATEIVEISDAVAPLRRVFVEAAPVRAGLVKTASDWPYSSAHNGTAQAGEMGVAVA
jgi:putative transposase